MRMFESSWWRKRRIAPVRPMPVSRPPATANIMLFEMITSRCTLRSDSLCLLDSLVSGCSAIMASGGLLALLRAVILPRK